ncbi:aminotransferase class IV [Clostridium chrysemydis]|uniref:aminotransferase class IV n=1 Tax=Clostridium chrysemydis TaxID=2665504 RepID=UPI001883850C|nr:aminotransferase class IV [Clostridium chrysemydis]
MRKIIFNEDKCFIDSSVNFGIGVFETIYFLESKPIFLNYHLGRLKNGLKVLNFKDLEEEEILEVINKIYLKNHALKILVTEKNIIISTRENNYDEETFKKGFKLDFSEVLRNSTSYLTYIKSTNYAINILEKIRAKSLELDDFIFLNEKGFVTETTVSNIFCIKDSKIYTPKISDGLLDGTVREFLIKNYNIIEKSITKEELLEMDEVFLTNSLMGIMKVKKISDKEFKSVATSKIKEFYNSSITLSGGDLNYDR